MSTAIAADPEHAALNELSAALGRDPRRTQAAGGNTSLKRDGVMWIKASGTWLADATARDIMVPVLLEPMLRAFEEGDIRAEKAVDFVDRAANSSGLRPSIETSVHAVMRQPVVVHIHCVETIALAVRSDGEARIRERLLPLRDVRLAYVPYRRPGLPLAAAIVEAMTPETNVVIFGNHGLLVAGESVAEVADRVERVCTALAAPARSSAEPDTDRLGAIAAGSGYRLPTLSEAHAVALDPISQSIVEQGSLYPDHVIFLGPGVVKGTVLEGRLLELLDAEGKPPRMLLLSGQGVLLHRDCDKGADAMARCLADVVARIPEGAPVLTLSPEQDYELTHWEAEQYRQALNRGTRP